MYIYYHIYCTSYNYMMYNIICINHIHCIRLRHIYLYIVFNVLLDKYIGNN